MCKFYKDQAYKDTGAAKTVWDKQSDLKLKDEG